MDPNFCPNNLQCPFYCSAFFKKLTFQVEDLCERTPEKAEKPKSIDGNFVWTNPRLKEREILALDIQHPSVGPYVEHSKTENIMRKSNSVFISLPNLNASSENLLV